jgi:hypothetical protein
VLSVPSTSEGKIPPLEWTTVPDAASHEILIRARMGGPADTLTASITPDEASLRTASPLARRLTFEPSLQVSGRGLTVPWRDAFAGIVAAGRARDPKSTVVEFQVTARDRYGAIAGRSEWRPLYLGIPD